MPTFKAPFITFFIPIRWLLGGLCMVLSLGLGLLTGFPPETLSPAEEIAGETGSVSSPFLPHLSNADLPGIRSHRQEQPLP
ncbi:MAG: hypothetical protein Q6L68_13880, partial [Thermostichus sp. DG02_5_bins_236]